MILHISIIWVGPVKSVEVLTPIFNLADDWLSYGPTLYVVRTKETAIAWQNRLRAVVAEQDSFFITEIPNPSTSTGWMPKSFWEWLRKDIPNTIEGYQGLAALLAPPK